MAASKMAASCPGAGDLHGVDDVAPGDQRLEGVDVVAVLEPAGPRRSASSSVGRRRTPRRAPRAGVDDRGRRPRRRRGARGWTRRSRRFRWTRCRRRAGARRRRAPRWMIRRMTSRAAANEVKPVGRRTPCRSGSGQAWSQARVMMPSVPSEPTNSWLRSGPTAWRGCPPVRITVPSARTTSRPTTMSSILP